MLRTKIYPGLGRYFRTVQELADTACMSRTRATDILKGRKELTDPENAAIVRAIVLKDHKITDFFDLDQKFKIERNNYGDQIL